MSDAVSKLRDELSGNADAIEANRIQLEDLINEHHRQMRVITNAGHKLRQRKLILERTQRLHEDEGMEIVHAKLVAHGEADRGELDPDPHSISLKPKGFRSGWVSGTSKQSNTPWFKLPLGASKR